MTNTRSPEVLSIEVDGGSMPADLHLPESAEGPGIVLYQEIFGVTDYITSRAADLAALGYVVLVPHLYHRLGDPVVEEGGDGLPQAMELMGRFDWEQGVKDGVAALAAVRDRVEVRGPAGVIGFCFGGGMAFNVAAVAAADRAAPDALVSYYGSALPTLLGMAPQVTSPSLHHFGTADDYIPMEKVEEIEAAVTADNDDVTFLTYEGAGHAFDNPSPMFHHEAASSQAWVATESFLLEKLPV
ncbi:dienelactone hydrolase family protein [Pedococcus soli]